ncbi:hypothetical protein MEM_00248 [Candida albicans L26]|uniref:Uncharacterized protein n=1 Tax=Candida albicans P78048 TaxID=1094989 RepID=A0AB34Q0G0_CANAX|nr:hypothetical protein MEU_00242 [Candida albicans P37005]KGR21289.1 hypothetical protein MG3_00289 [Candida albicans P78048]KGR23314.1 hypothetical protein MG9_00246 [Candida albicans P37037]KGT72444.1 hypothetical protein MEK_00246 [Candida albicans 12C]KGU18504.1 hypothetical protein MEM_00248 [Candida albicans L26]KGU19276.1 hypothetical protein MEY_00244 [Candida albicans 19F]KHC83037.1 hypothetical protein W5Q_00246 [Candida albicans SC5314]
MVRNHQGNKQPIEPSLVNQTTSKADYTTVLAYFNKYIPCNLGKRYRAKILKMCTNLNYNVYKAVFLNSSDVFIVFEILKSKLFEVLIACHWLDFSSEIE